MIGLDTELLWGGGECVPPRLHATATVTPASQGLRLTHFQSSRSEPVGHVGVVVQTVASGLTLCRIGVYTLDPTGALTLIASTASNTSVFNATGEVVQALSASFTKKATQWYAVGVLQVGTTPAVLAGYSVAAQMTAAVARLPRVCSSYGSQADLPAGSVANSSLSPQTTNIFVELLP